MTDNAYTIRIPRPSRLGATAAASLASALLGGATVLAGLSMLGPDRGPSPAAPVSYAAPGHAFQIRVPEGWEATRASDLARVPSSPLAALHRLDHRGLIVVRRTAPIGGDERTFARVLTARLSRRFKGFRAVSAREVRLRSGSAFLYTFVHGPTVQSVALANLGGASYTIESVSPGAATDVAQQIGASIGSFGP